MSSVNSSFNRGHSLGVRDECVKIARELGVDANQLYKEVVKKMAECSEEESGATPHMQTDPDPKLEEDDKDTKE